MKIKKMFIVMIAFLFVSCESGFEDMMSEANKIGFKVMYNGNGYTHGLVPSDRNYYQQGEIVTIKSSYATSSGNLVKIEDTSVSTSKAYYCSGWSDGTNIYQEGDTFVMGTSDAELTAQWTEYTVSVGNLATGPARGYIIHDQGSYSGGWRYIELAPEDANNGNTSVLASMTAACASYSACGYTGWYLMSNEEFGFIGYNNLNYGHNNYNLRQNATGSGCSYFSSTPPGGSWSITYYYFHTGGDGDGIGGPNLSHSGTFYGRAARKF
jgi:hypothetical protein